jgi:hypothetical protein
VERPDFSALPSRYSAIFERRGVVALAAQPMTAQEGRASRAEVARHFTTARAETRAIAGPMENIP